MLFRSNGEKYIKEQIESILKQLSYEDELIISDDKSTDKTLDIVNDINDRRIRLFVNEQRLGYTRNFENALSKSSGEIIFLSDQDDVWVENKVEMMLNALSQSQMVISDAKIVDSNLQTICESHFKLHRVKKGFFVNYVKTRYIGACMAFKREVLIKALPFPKLYKYCAHDYWLTLLAESVFKVTLIYTPLIFYRRHNDNASSGGGLSGNSIVLKILVRLYSILMLINRLLSK